MRRKAFKHFIGYAYVEKIIPLCLRLPRMIGYAKSFKTRSICRIYKKICKIWNKVSSIVNKKCSSKAVYNKKYLKM